MDGLWDPYHDYHVGMATELCASENKIDREAQDAFAKVSYERAQKAIDTGLFAEEIVPVEIPQRKGDPVVVDTNEKIGRVKFDRIPMLRPGFRKDGSAPAANASSINNGAPPLRPRPWPRPCGDRGPPRVGAGDLCPESSSGGPWRM